MKVRAFVVRFCSRGSWLELLPINLRKCHAFDHWAPSSAFDVTPDMAASMKWKCELCPINSPWCHSFDNRSAPMCTCKSYICTWNQSHMRALAGISLCITSTLKLNSCCNYCHQKHPPQLSRSFEQVPCKAARNLCTNQSAGNLCIASVAFSSRVKAPLRRRLEQQQELWEDSKESSWVLSAAHCTLSTNQSCEKTARNPLVRRGALNTLRWRLELWEDSKESACRLPLIRTPHSHTNEKHGFSCPHTLPSLLSTTQQPSRTNQPSLGIIWDPDEASRFILNNCSSPLVASRNGNDGNMLVAPTCQSLATNV